ncbi:MAG TPA: type II toxin-antitoxin system VapC family toxin [Gemmataceae bacterium]|nr:type II toxin-antitoxin system VapC family toxin [Gemmataceae bacterium]
MQAKGFAAMAKKKGKTKRTIFVLDSSITLAWLFEDEADAYAEAVEDSLIAAAAVVPSLWLLEVANGALIGERRKRTTEAKITQFLALLKSLPITADEETAAQAWQETLQLARTHNLSVYDAAYLELAMRCGLPLATLDEDLADAAAAVGVEKYKP